MEHHARRQERLRRQLTEERLDAYLISSPINVTYLTGFTGDSSLVVLSRDRTLLVSDPRYVGQLAEECPGLETHIRTPTTKLHDAVGQVLIRLGMHQVGCEAAALTLAEAEALKAAAPEVDWKPGNERVERLRQIKDEVELAEIRQAISLAERAFQAFRARLRPQDTEKDLADALEGHVRHCGATSCSFPPIVAVGERAALPHCPPTSKQVCQSELLLVDWGATTRGGYRSDLTRVLATHTKQSSVLSRLREIHQIVLRAQQAAFTAIRPGVLGKQVDQAARQLIANAGYGEYFGHGLGHGIGLQIHEGPAIRPLSETKLEPGMVFTLEPGIYLPGWGGVRIEDDVLVTEEGAERLTRIPQELEALTVFHEG